jgi:hypothetical protein
MPRREAGLFDACRFIDLPFNKSVFLANPADAVARAATRQAPGSGVTKPGVTPLGE